MHAMMGVIIILQFYVLVVMYVLSTQIIVYDLVLHMITEYNSQCVPGYAKKALAS